MDFLLAKRQHLGAGLHEMMMPRSKMTPSEQVAWDAMQARPQFRIRDVMCAASVSQSTAGEFVARWVRDDLVHVVARDAKGQTYQPIQGVAVLQQLGGGATPEGNMWRTARMLQDFSVIDIAAHAGTTNVAVSTDLARKYITGLMEAGYLRVTQKAIIGKREARYKLIRNTGPLAPHLRRMTVLVDYNTAAQVVLGGAK